MWTIKLSIKQNTPKDLKFTACNQQKSWDPSQKTVSKELNLFIYSRFAISVDWEKK